MAPKPPAHSGISMVLSVGLSDGSFESRVSLPITAADDQRQEVIKAWFDLMDKALRLAASVAPPPEPEKTP